MTMFKLDLDKETEKKVRDEIFRPLILSILVGIAASLIMTLVAAAILGFNIRDKQYSFSLNHADAWIIFTIFATMSVAISVVAYYRLKEEHQKLTDDVLTPFRKELVGEWRVYWSDVAYCNEGGAPSLEPTTDNDSCQFGIDNVGKLFIESELHNHPMLEDWKRRIEDIAINLQQKRLTFYDEARFTIRENRMRGADERSFDAKFFVFLGVDDVDDQMKVTRYKGRWYDLDGTFAKFKETLTRQMHSDLPSDIHFPRSGSVEYRKAPTPKAAS